MRTDIYRSSLPQTAQKRVDTPRRIHVGAIPLPHGSPDQRRARPMTRLYQRRPRDAAVDGMPGRFVAHRIQAVRASTQSVLNERPQRTAPETYTETGEASSQRSCHTPIYRLRGVRPNAETARANSTAPSSAAHEVECRESCSTLQHRNGCKEFPMKQMAISRRTIVEPQRVNGEPEPEERRQICMTMSREPYERAR